VSCAGPPIQDQASVPRPNICDHLFTYCRDKHEDEIGEVLYNIIAWRYFLVCLVGVAGCAFVTTRTVTTPIARSTTGPPGVLWAVSGDGLETEGV
jgi:hypothetical protein